MRILVAGATGVIGRQLVPRLVERGHDVTGTTTTSAKCRLVAEMGARPVVLDALAPDTVRRVVHDCEPEGIINQLTSLGGRLSLRRFDRSFAMTNRLRVEATDSLLSAAREVGTGRFVAQSFAGWPYGHSGGAVMTEDDPFDDDPLPQMRAGLAALRHLEQAVLGAGWCVGVVLRYGGLSGPGTSLDRDGEIPTLVRRRRFPIVGGGTGMLSFVDTRDAAAATVAAIEHGRRGVYNIVDEPVAVRDWLPAFARAVGAQPPHHVPRWLGRLLAGEVAVAMMNDVPGVSNAKAGHELGWAPEHASWRGRWT